MNNAIRRWDGQVVNPSRNRVDNLDHARALIDGWDLSVVSNSLRSNLLPWEHEWTSEHASFAEDMYRRWIFLARKHETSPMPPTHDIDGFWHAHILHTRDYAEFCDRVFGYFLHHNGGYGGKDEAEYQALTNAHASMLDFYQSEYGEPLYEQEDW